MIKKLRLIHNFIFFLSSCVYIIYHRSSSLEYDKSTLESRVLKSTIPLDDESFVIRFGPSTIHNVHSSSSIINPHDANQLNNKGVYRLIYTNYDTDSNISLCIYLELISHPSSSFISYISIVGKALLAGSELKALR